jgi:hypothetical protein
MRRCSSDCAPRRQFSNINGQLAARLVGESAGAPAAAPLTAAAAPAAELREQDGSFDEDADPSELTKKQIHVLTQLLREAKFAKPSGKVQRSWPPSRRCRIGWPLRAPRSA